jgi:hypothetical protein
MATSWRLAVQKCPLNLSSDTRAARDTNWDQIVTSVLPMRHVIAWPWELFLDGSFCAEGPRFDLVL